MPAIIYEGGALVGANGLHEAVLLLAKQEAARRLDGVAALTNNSGGTAGTITEVAGLTEAADGGTTLAQKASTEAALNTVLDGVGELFAKANAMADVLGIDQVTNNAGGTSPDGTLGAITVAVTAATTGVQDTETNGVIASLNNAIYQAAVLTNKLCAATGLAPVTIGYDKTVASTVAAITVSGGTAANPGLTKAAVDAALVTFRNNIKTIGDKLVALSGTTDPYIIAQ